MKSTSRRTGIILGLLLLTGGSIIGAVVYHKGKAKDKVSAAVPKLEKDTLVKHQIDTMKLKTLTEVYSNLNLNRDEFLIEGNINAKNGADTLERLNHLEYIFSKKGTSFYYKLGQTETINADGIAIYIDHGMKKVMISREKTIIPAAVMPDLSEIMKQINGEGFKLIGQRNGEIEKITLSNPYHLSCKEYSVTFNAQTLKAQRLYLRLTDFADPENNKKDNVIDFTIKRSERISEIERYISQNVVRKEKHGWVLNPPYENYELINTLSL